MKTVNIHVHVPRGSSSDERGVGACDARVVCVCVFVYLPVALVAPYGSPSRSGGGGNSLENVYIVLSPYVLLTVH